MSGTCAWCRAQLFGDSQAGARRFNSLRFCGVACMRKLSDSLLALLPHMTPDAGGYQEGEIVLPECPSPAD